MKILVIPNRGRSYNAVRPEAECYIKLAQMGHDVTIMTCKTNAYLNKYQESPIKIIELLSLKKYSLSVIKQIHQYIKTHQIDIVYATESNGIPNAAFGCIGTKAKMIAYRGTSGGMYKNDPTNYLCMLHPRINGVICVSTAVTKNVISKVRHSIKHNVKTIFKGHDLSWYKEPAVDLCELGSQPQLFNVLCIGSARPHKGLTIMIEAANYLTDLTNLRIILVGDKFNCEPFTSQIKNTGMAEHIIQTGFRNDVPAIAKACDILVLPSTSKEGLARVVLESLANGTPVIASANDGAIETIENDVNGYIVPIGDAKAIAERIRFLYQNTDTLNRLSNNCHNTIQTKMSHQKTVDEMIDFFEKMQVSE